MSSQHDPEEQFLYIICVGVTLLLLNLWNFILLCMYAGNAKILSAELRDHSKVVTRLLLDAPTQQESNLNRQYYPLSITPPPPAYHSVD